MKEAKRSPRSSYYYHAEETSDQFVRDGWVQVVCDLIPDSKHPTSTYLADILSGISRCDYFG